MVSTRNLKPKFSIGEKVLCYEPDPLKAKVLYNSKVLKILEEKESKRGLEFLIHFSGWNSTWDRYVTEDFILKDTEENRRLQQELAEKAQLTPGGNLYRREQQQQRRSKKHHHHHYHRHHHRKPSSASLSPNPYTTENLSPYNEMVETSRELTIAPEDTTTSTSDDTMSSCSDSENINSEFPPTCRSVVPALPLNTTLSGALLTDQNQVKQNNMLVSLPAAPNIIEILESFYRYYAALEINAFPNRTPSSNENAPPTLKDLIKSLNILIQIVDGIRIYFDVYVKSTLLYNNEHKQFDFYRNNFQRNPAPFRNAMRNDMMSSSIKKEIPTGLMNGHKDNSCTSSFKKDPFTSMMMRDSPLSSSLNEEINSVHSQASSEDKTDAFSQMDIKQELDSADEDDYVTHDKKPFLLLDNDRQDRKPDIRPYSPNRRDRLVEKVLNINNVLSSLSTSEGNVLSNHTSSESNILSNHSSEGSHQRLDSISSVDSTLSGRTNSSVSSGGAGPPPYLAHWEQTRSALLEKLSRWVFVPETVLQASPPLPSSMYGAVHLCRLFVKLPLILSNSVLSDEKIEYILEVTQDLADYMAEHEDWFRPNIYVNNTFC